MATICILSYSPIARDGRVLRQIKYLSQEHHVAIIGNGQPHPSWEGNPRIHWLPVDVPQAQPTTLPYKLFDFTMLALGRIVPAWYWWRSPTHQITLAKALSTGADIFHANEADSLPIAAEAARRTNTPFVLDLHEYWLRYKLNWRGRLFYAPALRHLIRSYGLRANACMTVAPRIAERYRQEFGFDPIVVMNAPDRVDIPHHDINPCQINLIHHGVPMRDRRLESMIHTIAQCDQRYHLHCMFAPNQSDPSYIHELQHLATQIAPERVTFHEPVSPEQVVPTIARYDMGFYLLEPSSYNNFAALPNKFFDFIVAGLSICIGPSPEMADLVQRYHCGCVVPTFDPSDAATTLNQLTPAQIQDMRQASRQAAQHLNADVEMGKVVELYRKLIT